MDFIDALQSLVYSIPTTDVDALQQSCRQFLSSLPPVASNIIDFRLYVLASDILVRLECNTVHSQKWTAEHLAVLNQRMDIIRTEMQGDIMSV